MPRMRMCRLFCSIQVRICPGVYLVVAPCMTRVLALSVGAFDLCGEVGATAAGGVLEEEEEASASGALPLPFNVSDRDPAHYRDAAHRAQPSQKQMLEIVDLSN